MFKHYWKKFFWSNRFLMFYLPCFVRIFFEYPKSPDIRRLFFDVLVVSKDKALMNDSKQKIKWNRPSSMYMPSTPLTLSQKRQEEASLINMPFIQHSEDIKNVNKGRPEILSSEYIARLINNDVQPTIYKMAEVRTAWSKYIVACKPSLFLIE